MEKKVSKFVYWTPRILSILFIAFLTLFSFDVFGEGLNWWEVALAFLIHNIPVFVLMTVLIISWKHEVVGGIVFILAGILYIDLLLLNRFEWYMLSWSMTIAGPAFLIGGLFLANWQKKKK